jgi:hypothetical protein
MSLTGGLLMMFGAAGAEWAGPLLDKAAEHLFDGAGKRALEDITAKLRAYTGDVPLNHDLEHAIRLAELTSTIVLLEAYRRQDEGDRFDSRTAMEPPFIPAARKWLHEQIGLSPRLTMVQNDRLVATLDQQLDNLLVARRPDEVRNTLRSAEQEVWHDLVAGVAEEPPPEFARLFFGYDSEKPGWSMMFLAFIREMFKKDPRTEVAFVTTRLAAVRSMLESVKEKVSTLQQETVSLLNNSMLALREEQRRIADEQSSIKSALSNIFTVLEQIAKNILSNAAPLDMLERYVLSLHSDIEKTCSLYLEMFRYLRSQLSRAETLDDQELAIRSFCEKREVALFARAKIINIFQGYSQSLKCDDCDYSMSGDHTSNNDQRKEITLLTCALASFFYPGTGGHHEDYSRSRAGFVLNENFVKCMEFDPQTIQVAVELLNEHIQDMLRLWGVYASTHARLRYKYS